MLICEKWARMSFWSQISFFFLFLLFAIATCGGPTKNLKSFCCKSKEWDAENWPFRAFSDNGQLICLTLNMPKQPKFVKISEFLLFLTEINHLVHGNT